MEDVPKPESLDANQVLMAASRRLGKQKMLDVASDGLNEADDPIYIAVVYRRHLIHIEESAPLYGISYYGQSVRSADTYADQYAVANERWYEENNLATRESHACGLLAVLETCGEAAFEDSIVEFRIGKRSIVQAWADELEKKLISDNGGTLRDMDKQLKQTLNITKGGKGAKWWEGHIALRNKAFQKFKEEMEVYVECYDTSLVPFKYVDPVTEYKLGQQLGNFRRGRMRFGMSNKSEIDAWAEKLHEDWAWNGKKTDQYHRKLSEAGKNKWANADSAKKAKWIANNKAAHNTQESIDASSRRAKKQLENESIAQRQSRIGKKLATEAAKSDEQRKLSLEKTSATLDKKRRNRFELLDPGERALREWLIESNLKEKEKQHKELASLRSLGGEWTNAKQSDIRRARALKLIPSRFDERKMNRDESLVAKNSQKNAKQKANLEFVRSLGGEWANATLRHLKLAREKGVLPNLNDPKNKSLRKKRKKRVTTTTTTKTVTEYKTESESSDEEEEDIESIVGSSSSAPLPKRRRRDADSDSD